MTTRVARCALAIEEHEYEMLHRKESSVSHVDSLSRYLVMMIIAEECVIDKLQVAHKKDEQSKKDIMLWRKPKKLSIKSSMFQSSKIIKKNYLVSCIRYIMGNK